MDVELFYAIMMQKILNEDFDEAVQAIENVIDQKPELLSIVPEMIYTLGLAYYGANKLRDATVAFSEATKSDPQNELAHFYFGNCFIRQRQFKEARICFENAISIRNSFNEARQNLAIVECSILQGYIKKFDWEKIDWNISLDLNFDVDNSDACFDIPIFINNRDRVECLSKLIDWLLEAGYRRIYILDQDSTYPPLIEFYETFRQDSRIHILRMENLGYKCIWDSRILETLNIQTPYVYTDSDVLPICGKNIVQELLRTLKQIPSAKKVGAKLICDDITFWNAEEIRKSQSAFYNADRLILPDVYCSQVDTTFAVYRNFRHYSLRTSVIRGDLEIRHLPWYYDLQNLPPDEKYYIEHANSSSTLSEQLKSNLKSHSSSSLNR